MKHILLSILGLLSVASVFSQQSVTDFATAMTSAPVGRKIDVMDVIYDNDAYNGIEVKSVRWRKPLKTTRDRYAAMGQIIDSLGLIDYRIDTIYVYSQGDLVRNSVFEIFKVGNNRFHYYKDATGKYEIEPYVNEYDNSTDLRIIASDSLFFNTIFSWNIDEFIRMIKASGGYETSDSYFYATRIILRDNRVIKRDVINFRQVMFWHL